MESETDHYVFLFNLIKLNTNRTLHALALNKPGNFFAMIKGQDKKFKFFFNRHPMKSPVYSSNTPPSSDKDAVNQLSFLYSQVNTLNSEYLHSNSPKRSIWPHSNSENVGEMTEYLSTIISNVVYFKGENWKSFPITDHISFRTGDP